MNQNIKTDWLSALRSGEFEQGKGYLKVRDPDTGKCELCCLGVLCELAIKAGVIPALEDREDGAFVYDEVSRAYLPVKVAVWAGIPDTSMPGSVQEILSSLNDSNDTFDATAEYIEENL
jgi:hypothetical protein